MHKFKAPLQFSSASLLIKWLTLGWLILPSSAIATNWQLVTSEPGKRIEINWASLTKTDQESSITGRIVFDKAIVDPLTSALYRTIEIENRFNCAERTYATLKRHYLKEDGQLLRPDELPIPLNMPVRTGSPDDKLLRKVCQQYAQEIAATDIGKTIDKVSEAAADLRQANEQQIETAVNKNLRQLRIKAGKDGLKQAASRPKMPTQTKAERQQEPPKTDVASANNAVLCDFGQEQAPIDLSNSLALDLEPIQSAYLPSAFHVQDTRQDLRVIINAGGFNLRGQSYALTQVVFHRPAEITVGGKTFAMDAQLMHKTSTGKQAILSVLFEQGAENIFVQQVLNNFPLERGGKIAVNKPRINVNQLLTNTERYFTFMGSLSSPPCTENVLWLVLKDVQQMSPEQLAIFERLYAPNARAVQPTFERIIKESR